MTSRAIIDNQHGLDLPGGWSITSLGKVVTKLVDGSHNPPAKRDVGRPMLSARNIVNGEIVFNEYRFITNKDFEREHVRTRVSPGDVLLTIVGTIGRSAVVPVAAKPFTLQRSVAVMTPNGVLPRFLMYQLQAPSTQHYFEANARGTAQKGVYLKTLSETPIRVASLNQQQNIVAEIEKQFSRLDEAVAALKRTKANLKRYKAAVLKAAVEGKLTKDWRKQHPNVEPASKLLERILAERRAKWKGKYKEPVVPIISTLPLLPEGWTWAVVDQLGIVQLGRQRSPKNRSKDHPVQYLRAANITEAGLDLSDLLDMEFSLEEQKRYRLKSGDLVLSEASGSPSQVGKPAVWRDQLPLCCFQNTVIRLRPSGDLSPYLLACFKSYYVNGVFSNVASGVGINHLSADKFSKVAVPLPPVAEQLQIVAEIERRLSVIDELEVTIEANLTRTDRLRQSILGQAFSGKL